jgi:glutaminase
MNYQGILEQIHHDLQPYLGTGRVADYIPELAKVPADSFGMAIVTTTGEVFRTGEANTRFSIQSISKLFAVPDGSRPTRCHNSSPSSRKAMVQANSLEIL